jgi:hypothetical protein
MQAFNGSDMALADFVNRRLASPRRFAVNVDSTRAALIDTLTVFSTDQMQMVAQHP